MREKGIGKTYAKKCLPLPLDIRHTYTYPQTILNFIHFIFLNFSEKVSNWATTPGAFEGLTDLNEKTIRIE